MKRLLPGETDVTFGAETPAPFVEDDGTPVLDVEPDPEVPPCRAFDSVAEDADGKPRVLLFGTVVVIKRPSGDPP